MPTEQDILNVLSEIQDPDLGRDVVALGMIKDLVVDPGGRVSFTFELTTPACPVKDRFESMAQDLVGGLPGVTAVEVKMTSHVRQRIRSLVCQAELFGACRFNCAARFCPSANDNAVGNRIP